MKKTTFTNRGQALILVALAAFGLFGIAGLAIDGSAKFSDRRHAQNAADTAAVAAALSLARGESDWELKALDRAGENGYDDNPLDEVEVHNPPISGVYSNCSDVHFDCHDYVQVIIDSDVKTYFARIVGITETHNHVEAVASTISQDETFRFGGNAIVALKSSGCDTLVAQGGSQVKIYGGGLYSNSDAGSCAFFRQSCPSGSIGVYTDNTETTTGTITMVGGTSSSCGTTYASFDPGATQISFPPPYQEVSEPAECSQTVNLGTNYTVTGSGSNKTATLSPGHYSVIPLSGQWKNIILNPGVYCIDSSLSSPTSLTISTGSTAGVFIYIRSGGSFSFNGGSAISLWGINSDNGSSLDDEYHGFLMYVAPNYSTGTPVTCLLNGNTDYALKGTIYAPYCDITINGTSNTGKFQSQVIGYTVKMAGTADIILSYDGGSTAVWNIPLQVGLTK